MTDVLQDLLGLGNEDQQPTRLDSATTSAYLTRISTLSLPALTSTETEALSHDIQSVQRSLQALSKRSYRSIGAAEDLLSGLGDDIPRLARNVAQLQELVPTVENEALKFAEKYSKAHENPLLKRRKRAMQLGDNIERLSDILELPSLLSSTIATSSSNISSATAGQLSSANASYASALDLHAHVKRLHKLYPTSHLVTSISSQADEALRGMTSNLIASLKHPSLKLAGAMRVIGLLRRVAPDLDSHTDGIGSWMSTSSEGSLGSLFLVCRLANLTNTLQALEPLKELADQETPVRNKDTHPAQARPQWSKGQQTERYLKRYIETFREQCFAIVSMYKSIFPTALQESTAAGPLIATPFSQLSHQKDSHVEDPLQIIPSALATFISHIVDMLMDTLQQYLSNVQDRNTRDSLVTQVLYCASSLGRLGADFSLMLPLLYESFDNGEEGLRENDDVVSSLEWVDVIKKHRFQASRLEVLASGVSTRGKETSTPI